MNKYKQFSKAKFGAHQCGRDRPKAKYSSKKDAEAAVETLREIGVKRAYQCGVCGYWHLTSQDFSEKFKEYNNQ